MITGGGNPGVGRGAEEVAAGVPGFFELQALAMAAAVRMELEGGTPQDTAQAVAVGGVINLGPNTAATAPPESSLSSRSRDDHRAPWPCRFRRCRFHLWDF